jgi:hypothetical protein
VICAATPAWHYIGRWDQSVLAWWDGRREGDTGGAESETGGSTETPGRAPLAVASRPPRRRAHQGVPSIIALSQCSGGVTCFVLT